LSISREKRKSQQPKPRTCRSFSQEPKDKINSKHDGLVDDIAKDDTVNVNGEQIEKQLELLMHQQDKDEHQKKLVCLIHNNNSQKDHVQYKYTYIYRWCFSKKKNILFSVNFIQYQFCENDVIFNSS
jgi:hypothetical protein